MRYFLPFTSFRPILWRHNPWMSATQAVIFFLAYTFFLVPLKAQENPTGLTNVSGTLFFAASTPDKGTELWKSNGTTAGTVLVKDIAPLEVSSAPANLTKVGSSLYFTARGTELWKSNGTTEGTLLVKSFSSSVASPFSHLTDVNGVLYFVVREGRDTYELWKSDGTSAGTILLKSVSSFTSLTNLNGVLYFSGYDAATGIELWKSNGTSAGTVLVKDIYPGYRSSAPFNLYAWNGNLYFAADNGSVGYELWKSDGTAAGTLLLKNIGPMTFVREEHGESYESGSNPSQFVSFKGELYFTARDYEDYYHSYDRYGLWKTNGTSQGTILVTYMTSAPYEGRDHELTVVNEILFFKKEIIGYDNDKYHDLWKSDGTAQGTVLVKQIGEAYGSGTSLSLHLTNMNGALFFANQGSLSNDGELWKSDGTPAGTLQLKEIYPDTNPDKPNSSSPKELTAINSTLFFSAYDGTGVGGNRQLWKSDGTEAGTVKLTTQISKLPLPWNSRDIGAVAIAGSATYSKESNINSSNIERFTVKSGGYDFFKAPDAFHYVYQSFTGNGSITAYVENIQNTNPNALAGLMIRESLSPSASFAAVAVNPTNTNFMYRQGAGTPGYKQVSGSAPRWLRISRSGNTFSAYWSADWINWQLIGTKNISMGNTVYIGMALTSQNNSTLNTATFSQVQLMYNPVVAISSPANNSNYVAPASITIAASASSMNRDMYSVEFYNGFTLLGTDYESPYSYTWTNVPAGTYSLTARATNLQNATTTSETVTVTVGSSPTCSASGSILREYWSNIAGKEVTAIPVNTAPASTSQLSSFEAPTNIGDNYGQRIRGYICAPASGNYTFYIASDDNSELWLSTTDSPSSKRKIASVTGWARNGDWVKYPSQKSGTIALEKGKKYYIEALHKEANGGDNLAVAWATPGSGSISIIPGSVLSPVVPTAIACNATGSILREYWANVSGGTVASIPLTTTPSSSTQISSFETPSGIGDNYGQRIRGYICAPATGSYTFYIAADDQAELWLSSSDSPASKQKIAYLTAHTSARQWTKYASQKSVVVSLEKGKKYYIEALHKEAIYGDNLAVGWTVPGSTSITVIPGSVLSPFVPSAARLAGEEELQASPLVVYPNPFSEKLTIATSGQEGKLIITLTDVVGKTYFVKEYVLSGQSEVELALTGLSLKAGMHLLKLQSEDGKTQVIKVLKK